MNYKNFMNLIEQITDTRVYHYKPEGINREIIKIAKKYRKVKDFWKKNDLFLAGIPFMTKIPGYAGEYIVNPENGYAVVYSADGRHAYEVFPDYFKMAEFFMRRYKRNPAQRERYKDVSKFIKTMDKPYRRFG